MLHVYIYIYELSLTFAQMHSHTIYFHINCVYTVQVEKYYGAAIQVKNVN